MSKLFKFLLLAQPLLSYGRRDLLQSVQVPSLETDVQVMDDVPQEMDEQVVDYVPRETDEQIMDYVPSETDYKQVVSDFEVNEEEVLCSEDLFDCWDGTKVGRDFNKDCVFRACPLNNSIEMCSEGRLKETKDVARVSDCVDGCDCMKEHITFLSTLQCVIPDDVMDEIETRDHVLSNCEQVRERKDMLRDSQNSCRSGACKDNHEEIDVIIERDDEERKSKTQPYEDDEVEPVRDIDEIQREADNIREVVDTCLPKCDQYDDVCSILRKDDNSTRLMMKNCGDVCDVQEIKNKLYESCSKMDRNTIDAAMDFYGDESGAHMFTLGALIFLFQIVF